MQQYPIGNRFAQAMHKQVGIYVLYNDACYWCMFFFVLQKELVTHQRKTANHFPTTLCMARKRL